MLTEKKVRFDQAFIQTTDISSPISKSCSARSAYTNLSILERNSNESKFKHAPSSDEYKIIFPWDELNKEYSQIDFHPINFKDAVSYSEVQQVFDSLKKLEIYDVDAYTRKRRILSKILSLLIQITIGCMIWLQVDHIDLIGTNCNIAVQLIPILTLQYQILIIIKKIARHHFQKVVIRRTFDFTNILDNWNQVKYFSRGFVWACGQEGAWLELDVLYKFKSSYPYENVPRIRWLEKDMGVKEVKSEVINGFLQ